MPRDGGTHKWWTAPPRSPTWQRRWGRRWQSSDGHTYIQTHNMHACTRPHGGLRTVTASPRLIWSRTSSCSWRTSSSLRQWPCRRAARTKECTQEHHQERVQAARARYRRTRCCLQTAGPKEIETPVPESTALQATPRPTPVPAPAPEPLLLPFIHKTSPLSSGCPR